MNNLNASILRALVGVVLGAGLVTTSSAAAEEKILNIYNWSDYIGPDYSESNQAAQIKQKIGDITIWR